MDRRYFLTLLSIAPSLLFANEQSPKFNISINGDLDDDLIILRSTIHGTEIVELHQMHNPKNKLIFNGKLYQSTHIPGYIEFNKSFPISKNEIYVICLANEREEANFPISKRFRTHYKNEVLKINNQELLPALMPEYNSVPGYPLWFNEENLPKIDKKDINGDTYNYYNLFENTTVQCGIIVPFAKDVKISLFDQKDQLQYTFNETLSTKPKNLKSDELKSKKLDKHPFTEINNILNLDPKVQQQNNDYIKTIIIEYGNGTYTVPLPYPIMYPNLMFGTSIK